MTSAAKAAVARSKVLIVVSFLASGCPLSHERTMDTVLAPRPALAGQSSAFAGQALRSSGRGAMPHQAGGGRIRPAIGTEKGAGGGYFENIDRSIMTARGLFRVGEMKIFPGYSFPNEEDRSSNTSDPR